MHTTVTACDRCSASLPEAARFCASCGTPVLGDCTGRVLAGRYRLVGLLGTGGMGRVYRAEHVTLGRPFAVKLLNPALVTDEEMVERFRREALAAGRLLHPHIAATLDFGEEDGLRYIVMELIDGPSLQRLIATQGRFAPPRALELARQIASALAVVHAAGVVHRDVKPGNVLLTTGARGEELAKLVDFGLVNLRARDETSDAPTEAHLTATGVGLGTPAYAAPEQVMGMPVDGRADLYGLGALLYELLTGAPPFVATSRVQLVMLHLRGEVAPLAKRVEELARWPELDAFVRQLLEKEPDRRPASAREVEDHLAALLAAGPSAVASDRDILDQLSRI